MNYMERIYLDKAIFYKKEYKSTPWYKFRDRRSLYKKWHSSLESMHEHQK